MTMHLDWATNPGSPNAARPPIADRHRLGIRLAALALALAAHALLAHAALAAGLAVRPSAPLTTTVTAWHPDTVDAVAFLPTVNETVGGLACDTAVRVQNVGGDFAKAVLVAWGAPGLCPPQCTGPVKVECSGLLKPGSAWTFQQAQLPAEARSAAVFSFTTRNLSEVAPGLVPPDDVVADYMCETLFFGAVGDCDDYRRFAKAFTRGLQFAGIPQDKAAGGPLAVWVSRDCPAGSDAIDYSGTYAAPSGAGVGGFDATGRSFRYVVPVGATSLADPAPRALYVQNAGLECVTVSVSAVVDCGRTLACPGMKLAPGERAVLRHTDCDLDGGAVIEADGPLAAVLDDVGAGNLAALPAEAEQRWSYLDAAVAERQAGGQELSAPLVYRDYQGWSTGFVVQNLSRTTEAQVRALVLDRAGDVISSYQPPRICPLGTLRIAPGELSEMPGNFVGSIRIVNVDWWLPGAGVTDPPRLAGWAGAWSATGGGDADAYPLIGRPRFEDWPPGAEQVGLVALPLLTKTAKDGGLTSELSIVNVVQKPGFTDFAVYIYDQNGLLDYICQKLNEKQAEHINLQSWGYVNPGFVGSAVVSATFWEHDVFEGGPVPRNLVGLEAVTALRPAHVTPWRPGQPTPAPLAGDAPSWAAPGVPFDLLASRGFGASQLPQCPDPGVPRPTPPKVGWTPTPTPTAAATRTPTPPPPAPAYLPVLWNVRDGTEAPPTPSPTPTPQVGPEAEGEGAPYLPPSPQVFVPVLNVTNADTPCRGQVHVMNVSPDPLVALMVLWDVEQLCDENCPSSVVCSGLIRPGTRWTFAPPTGRSAALFSLRAGTLADIGVADPGGRTIAAAVCDTLSAAIHPCNGTDAYAEWKRAYDNGGDYHGVPMAKARGGELAVQVDRSCPASDTADLGATSSYQGVAASDTGAPDTYDGRLWFSLPLIYSAKAGYDSAIYVQNASSECATVAVYGKAQDDCLRMKQCGALTIPAGQMRVVSPYACTGDDWQGGYYAASDQPLALAVDLAGRDVLMTYNGEPLSVRNPTTLAAEPAGSPVLIAPLMYSEYQGWDTGIQVHNSSREVNAKVKAYFLDRSGDIITTLVDWICPLGSQTYFLPVVHDMPGDWVGSVRVESQQWATPGSPTIQPPRLTGLVTLTKYNNASREHAIAAAAYNLLAEADAYDWRTGRGKGGIESGVGLVALPYLAQPTELGARTELAATNVVPRPGFTQFTLALFDANGRVDDLCLMLNEKQVAYLDLARWGHLSPTFTGSALLSATYWNHDVFDGAGRFVRRVVSLTAAVAERSAGERGADAPGDELAITTGIPLRGALAERLLPTLADVGCRVMIDDETEIWVEAPQPGAPMGELFVPALRLGPDTSSCGATLTVQNIGSGGYQGAVDTKALVLAWGTARCPADCAPVMGVVCTGLIKPGASWSLGPETWPAGAAGATVFSLTPAAADRLCASLATAVGADCARARAFVDTYRTGGAFDGVQLARDYGSGLAVEVLRHCPALGAPDLPTHATYRGANMAEARRADNQRGAFRYSLPQIGNAFGLGKTVVHVQNAGPECANVTLAVAFADGGANRPVCATATIPPGATASLDAEACRKDGWLVGAGIVEGDQPLVIAIDTAAPYALTSYTARAAGDSAGASTVAFAPLAFSEYQGWDTAIHVQNLHLGQEGRVKVVFQDRSGDIIDTVTDWLCPGCATVLRLDVVTDIPGNWVGSVRVESLDYPRPGGGRAGPVQIQAVARLVRGGDGGDRGTRTEAAAYSLLGPGFTPTEGVWPTGTPGGRMTADLGRLALPDLHKGTDAAPGGSEIAIANLVPVPGFTDFAIRLFDQNGLMDTVCQKLNERQVEYIDLASWGYVSPSFRGSGVISAVFWDHELRDPAGRPSRNLVGLGAVLLQRAGTKLGKDGPGDELSATEAWPLGDGLTDLNLPAPKCPPPYPPTPTPAPSRPDGPAR